MFYCIGIVIGIWFIVKCILGLGRKIKTKH